MIQSHAYKLARQVFLITHIGQSFQTKYTRSVTVLLTECNTPDIDDTEDLDR